MSIIKLPLHYEGSQGEKTLYTLFDKDITYSCINGDCVKDLCLLNQLRHTKLIKTEVNAHFIEIKQVALLDFYINEILLSDEFMVVPNLSEQVILGTTTLQKWRIKLDFDSDKVTVDPKAAKWILKELK